MLKGLAIKLRKLNRICPIKGSHEENINIGSQVIVETDRGVEFGQIIEVCEQILISVIRDVKLKRVVRYAGTEDRERVNEMTSNEQTAANLCTDKIAEYDLPIKLIDAEEMFDKSKMFFYYNQFEPNKTINTKELAKNIAGILKIKIDMIMIQPRDKARICGGLGPCGKTLCCSSWLQKYPHVTVKTIKGQGLSLSSNKTSGMCGRLLCCMKYEAE